MEIIAGAMEWLPTDEENLAKFLDTDTGKRLLPKLADLAPDLLAAGDTNSILIRTGELRGYRDVMRTILTLAHPPARSDVSDGKPGEYVPLDDDKHWGDKQKLNDPNASFESFQFPEVKQQQ